MQYCAAPRLDAAWRMRFSLKKCCTTPRPRPSPPKIGESRHPHVGQRDVGVIGRHVEGPQELLDLEPGRVRRRQEGGDPPTVAGLAAGAGEDQVVLRLVDPGVPRLLAVDDPVVAVAHGRGLHVGGVGAVVGLGDAEGEARGVPRARSSTHSAFCSSVPWSSISSRPTLLPTIECSFCRSLCSPRPLAAKCSRITAMPRLVPSRAAVLLGERRSGSGRRRRPAGGPLRSSASHSSLGRPPRSQSVRASSRRWSKKRMLSSASSSGLISRSMKSSSSAEVLDEVGREG